MTDAWWWHEGFAHTYVMFQKLSRPHAGPLNIYDPKHWPLMISWMGLVGPKFDWWPICQSWRADLMDITISIARLVMLVRTLVRLQRVRRCVNHSLRRLGAPPMAKITLKVPCACQVLPARSLWKSTVATGAWSDLAKSWFMSQVRVVHGKPKTFQSLCRVSSLARKVSWEEVLGHDHGFSLQQRVSMLHSRKVPRRWDIEVRRSTEDLVHEVIEVIMLVVNKYLHAGSTIQHLLWYHGDSLRCHAAIARTEKHWLASRREYAAHSQGMMPDDDCVVVPDDKEKKVCWIVRRPMFNISVLNYVTNNGMWKLTSKSLEKANRDTYHILKSRSTTQVT